MRSGKTLLLVMLAVAVLAILLTEAGCGGGAVTTTVGVPTTIEVITTTTTTAAAATTAAAVTLDAYRSDMKALWDQYGYKVSAMSDALTINDPTNMTDAELKSVQDFTDALRAFVTGLAKITPPAEVADAHATYLDVLTQMADGFDQFLTAVKAKQTSGMLTAMGAISKVVETEDTAMTAAEDKLQQVLGFSLSNDSSSETTTTVAAGTGDMQNYVDATEHFGFLYPAAWKIDNDISMDATAGGSAASSVAAYDPQGTSADGTYIDLMLVSTYKLNSTITDSMIPSLKGEIEGVLSSLESQVTDAHVVSALAQTEVAGLKGYTVTYTFTKDNVPTTSTLYFLFKGDVEYQLSVQSSTDHWDGNQATFAAMLASFSAP